MRNSSTNPHSRPDAATDAQRALFLAAETMLAISHGTAFHVGINLFSVYYLIVPLVMLRSDVFGRVTAFAGVAAAILNLNVLAGNTMSGALPLTIYLPAILSVLLVGWLPAYRMLMVWVYDRTGSLLLAMLMHASLTFSALSVAPLAISGAALVTYQLVWAAALWVVVAVVTAANRWRFKRQPPLRRSVA